MYPYHQKTRPYGGAIRAKEKTAPLSTDRRLQELLALAQTEALAMQRRYQALRDMEALAEARDILHTMYLNTCKQQRRLREASFALFGDTPQTLPAAESPLPADAEALLTETLLAEMDNVPFFRALYTAMEDAELRDAFFEILTDTQTHIGGLNYLYAKYLR